MYHVSTKQEKAKVAVLISVFLRERETLTQKVLHSKMSSRKIEPPSRKFF